MNDRNIVFLISQPRSGSTLTQRILSAHSRIYSTAEPWLMLHPAYALKTRGIQTDYNAGLAYNALQDVMALLPGGINDYMEAISKFGTHLYGKLLEERKEDIFLDKTPRYYKIIPELLEIYPKAKFVFLVRNPAAVFVSVWKTWARHHQQLLAQHRDDLFQALEKITEGIKSSGGRGYVLQYETLIAQPEHQIKKLCEFLDIKFESEMLDYSKAKVGEGRMGDPVKVNRHTEVVKNYSEAWKADINNATIGFLIGEYVKNLNPYLVRQLGYNYLEILLDIKIAAKNTDTPKDDEKNRLRGILGTNIYAHSRQDRKLLILMDKIEEKLSPMIENSSEPQLLKWVQENLPEKLRSHNYAKTYFEALVKLYKGNLQEAELLLKNILKKDKAFFKAAVQLALLYWADDKKPQALRYIKYARQQAPGYRQTLEPCLQMWEQLGRKEDMLDEMALYYAHNPADEASVEKIINLLSQVDSAEWQKNILEKFKILEHSERNSISSYNDG